ncbi:hypothetical protein [Streptomyces sp. DH10]|uniref:hypothetical protein n=1 Tax=Streptomyces sp. DH10 TaxID=3040121 RepID=UPI002442B038|nr:hypothetical protein [Streptomyces sp. DH10]MDG9706942.1 hypothetical protein [Streptomyces sp. DH10]
MQNLTQWEQEWVRVQEELRQHSGVRVLRDTRGPLLQDAIVPGSEQILRFSEFGSQWQTVEPYPVVTGEFFLTPLAKALREDPPSFDASLYSDEEQRVGAELHVIDDAPFTGAGSFTAIRMKTGTTATPEMWFSDHVRGLWQMDLDYTTYVELLRLTKGAFGWQHLYTEAPLDDWEFERTAERVARMLDVLPQVFPDYDYTPLRQRWDARR